jgi:hypothetical protein
LFVFQLDVVDWFLFGSEALFTLLLLLYHVKLCLNGICLFNLDSQFCFDWF